MKNDIFSSERKSLMEMPWHKDYMAKGKYDVVALHTVWNQKEFNRILGPNVGSYACNIEWSCL